MNDLVITIVNVSFSLLVLVQIHKNYKIKDAKSHSYIWHGMTCCGFVVLGYEYAMGGYFFSTLTIFLNFVFRFVVILQMLYYNRKENKIESWL